MIKQLKKIGIPLFISLTMAWPAQAGIIDLFDVDQAELEDTTLADGGESSSVSDGGSGSILGGERDLFVELLTQNIAGNDARVEVAGGAISFAVDPGSAATATIQWDGADGSSAIDTDGIDADLTAGGSTGFLIDVLAADFGFTFLINTWWDDGNEFASASFTSIGATFPGFDSFIPFNAAEFDPNIDFSDISALEIIIDPLGGQIALDLAVGSLTTPVPEPTGLALFSLTLIGLVIQRRRQRK